ncbi:hypothetical protein [Paenibacillus kribbensis]|nr:hypothetical protein [Paenibacillus kribbensis]
MKNSSLTQQTNCYFIEVLLLREMLGGKVDICTSHTASGIT